MLFLFYILCWNFSIGQVKHDYIWILGDINSATDSSFGGTDINFNANPPERQYAQRVLDIELTNASICDAEGNFLFYTNGCYIANADHEIMDNSKINPGIIHNAQCGNMGDDGYTAAQGAFVLPLPNNPNTYYLFHQHENIIDSPPTFIFTVDTLFYTIIDMSKNNGLGEVIIANYPLLDDDMDSGQLTAVKHQNGEDWWIVVPQRFTDEYHVFLFTENGIENHFEQQIGVATTPGSGSSGQAVFSPDGTTYARYNKIDGVFLFDF